MSPLRKLALGAGVVLFFTTGLMAYAKLISDLARVVVMVQL